MSAWLVRAGSHGEREAFVFDHGCAGTGWEDVPDNRITNYAAQLHALRNRIVVGDLVVLPLKAGAQIAIGRVSGPYRYVTDAEPAYRRRIGVAWHRTDIPRTAGHQDLLYSLGAFLTICQLSRNDAAHRLEQLLKTGLDPGAMVEGPTALPETADTELLDTSVTSFDLADCGPKGSAATSCLKAPTAVSISMPAKALSVSTDTVRPEEEDHAARLAANHL